MRSASVFAAMALCAATNAQTLGLLQYDEAYGEGYMLFAPIASTHTYLIDRCGRKVNEWTALYNPGTTAQLQPDGTLLRAANIGNPQFDGGGRGGRITRFSWDGVVLWSYDLSNDTLCQHHDFTVLPNGNILAIAWHAKDSAEAVAHGKDPALAAADLWSEMLVELEPVGNGSASIVWQWRAWDHMVQDFDNGLPGYGVVAEHPELVDINFFQGPPTSPDWIHLNSVSYNAELDQVMVSSHSLDEIWIIDHSTTTAEAAGHTGGNSGHGGDLLYRWGNPRGYDRGDEDDRRLYGQHHATWLPPGHEHAGKILVFNNGLGRPGDDYSSLDIIAPPVDGSGNYSISNGLPFAPEQPVWSYVAPVPTDFYSINISGVFPVDDGYFVTDGSHGRFFQLDADEQMRWQYQNPVNHLGPMTQGSTPFAVSVYRCEYYPPDFPGLIGQTLTPGDPIEINPTEPSLCSTTSLMDDGAVDAPRIFPNPATDRFQVEWPGHPPAQVHLSDATGRNAVVMSGIASGPLGVDVRGLPPGTYLLTGTDRDGASIRTPVIIAR